MALCILEELLEEYLKSLFDERVVSDHFSQIQNAKSREGPDFVVQLISTYFSDMEDLLSQLETLSDLSDIDFPKLAQLSQKAKDLSSCIGAEQVKLVCADLLRACDLMNKYNFSVALILMKNEFGRTRKKLEAYAQMERKIMRLQSRQTQN